ncbi:MAG: GNAT family N-acetyltransferase [Candidatus Acetothermia bacterium]|jgi:GNAT superfamily N-acetyltransferase|nr:GNAT family N-acetyltransferase [Candidatus Acetothermia bacterium]
MFEIRVVELTAEHRDQAAHVLAAVFRGEASVLHAFNLASGRHERAYRRAVALWVEDHLRAGRPLFGAVLGGRVVGVAGVSGVGGTPTGWSVRQLFHVLPGLLGLLPAVRVRPALALLRASRRPPGIPPRPHMLEKIGVLPELQGRGIGRRLLAHVHELCASDQGASGVYLYTVGERNRGFYERQGYRTVHVAPAAGLEVYHMFRHRSG